jgi:hypothetical protein
MEGGSPQKGTYKTVSRSHFIAFLFPKPGTDPRVRVREACLISRKSSPSLPLFFPYTNYYRRTCSTYPARFIARPYIGCLRYFEYTYICNTIKVFIKLIQYHSLRNMERKWYNEGLNIHTYNLFFFIRVIMYLDIPFLVQILCLMLHNNSFLKYKKKSTN